MQPSVSSVHRRARDNVRGSSDFCHILRRQEPLGVTRLFDFAPVSETGDGSDIPRIGCEFDFNFFQSERRNLAPASESAVALPGRGPSSLCSSGFRLRTPARLLWLIKTERRPVFSVRRTLCLGSGAQHGVVVDLFEPLGIMRAISTAKTLDVVLSHPDSETNRSSELEVARPRLYSGDAAHRAVAGRQPCRHAEALRIGLQAARPR